MAEIPERANFYCTLTGTMSKRQIARVFEREGWSVGKAAWYDFEVDSNFAELIIEADAPILIHGCVADVLSNSESILKIISDAGVGFSAECYDDNHQLLREIKSPA
jgi:hypothetical protein